jgi:DNA-binding transcriptional MerR regulator
VGTTNDEFFAIGEVARNFNISPDTVRRYEDQGVYTAKRICNRRVLTAENVEAIAKHRKRIERMRQRVQ